MKDKILNTLSDAELIGKIKGSDTSGYFKILYERYFNKVLGKCHSFVKDRNVAEELTEDIFSKVFEKLSSFKQLSSFSSWLYAITYNHCIEYLREKQKLHYPEWNRNNEIPEIIDEPEEIIEIIEYDKVMQILELIHPEEKALLLMKYKDELTMKQIGVSLRISEDAAKMRLKRARARGVYLYNKNYLSKE